MVATGSTNEAVAAAQVARCGATCLHFFLGARSIAAESAHAPELDLEHEVVGKVSTFSYIRERGGAMSLAGSAPKTRRLMGAPDEDLTSRR
jgi:fructoselysine-6-P-deglycase FrlB-like protein